MSHFPLASAAGKANHFPSGERLGYEYCVKGTCRTRVVMSGLTEIPDGPRSNQPTTPRTRTAVAPMAMGPTMPLRGPDCTAPISTIPDGDGMPGEDPGVVGG